MAVTRSNGPSGGRGVSGGTCKSRSPRPYPRHAGREVPRASASPCRPRPVSGWRSGPTRHIDYRCGRIVAPAPSCGFPRAPPACLGSPAAHPGGECSRSARRWLDARGVHVPLASNPTLGIRSSLQPLFFGSLKKRDASRTTQEPKPPECNKNVFGYAGQYRMSACQWHRSR